MAPTCAVCWRQLALTPVVLAVPMALLPAQDKATLRHLLTPGTSFGYGIAVEVDVEQQFDAGQERTRLSFALHFSARVDEAALALAKVPHRVERVVAKSDSRLARIDYDSALPGSDPGAMEPLARLLGETFVVHVDPRGRVDHVDLPERLRGGAEAALGGDFDSVFAVYFAALPEPAVAPDDEWTTEIRLLDPKTIGKSAVPARHKLVRLTPDKATIEIAFDVGRPHRPGVLFEVLAAKGNVVFDRRLGRVEQSELELAARATRELGKGRTISGTSRVLVRVLR